MPQKLALFQKLVAILLGSLLTLTLAPGGSLHAQEASSGWKDIAAGGRFSIGVKQDGSVWTWGESNFSGVFGNGESGPSAVNTMQPTQVTGLHDVISVAAGSSHGLAVTKDGSVWTWGDNSDGQLGTGNKTLHASGTGEITENHNSMVPIQIQGLSHVVKVWGSWSKSFAIKDDGTLWAWGGFYYRKADGTIDSYSTPVQLRFQHVVSISTGYGDNLLVLDKEGNVWTLKQGSVVKMEALHDIQAVAAGGADSYALQKDGSVWVFGSNGNGTVAGKDTSEAQAPQKVQGLQDVADIQASAGGPLFLKKDGTVWTSGDNVGGQLGIGTYEDSEIPVQVNHLMKITKVASHGTGFRAMALREDGSLWSWGGGYTGDGTKWYRTEPVWIKSNDADIEPPALLISVQLNGSLLTFEQQPLIINDNTMVPLRKIFEALGAHISWDPATSTITATKEGKTITLTVGQSMSSVNGTALPLESPPVVIQGNTLVPVRFIAESLGANVNWDPGSKTVRIVTK